MSETAETENLPLKQIIEAALLAAGEPLNHARIASLFDENAQPALADISKALEELQEDCASRGVELMQVASGFRLQVKQSLQGWVSKLWTERPQRYSRAMLETLSLIAYRQPITRGEIESVRGVSLSSNIIRTMQEREWIRVVGHRDVPGKPALFGTTREFLDYFNLTSLDDMPTLSEIRDLESLEPELNLEPPAEPAEDDPEAQESMDTAEAISEDEVPGDDTPEEPGTESSDHGQ
jgi:segregation and condensation protein B